MERVNLRRIRIKKNGDVPLDFAGRFFAPLDIRVYSSFKEEKEMEALKDFTGGIDPGIRNFLEDFNRLPFVYSNGTSCSGLFREHEGYPIRNSIRSIEKRRHISNNLNAYYLPDSMHTLEFAFAYNLADPLRENFLEDIERSNDNPFSVTIKTNVTHKVLDPYRELMTEGVVNFWNNGTARILKIRNYDNNRNFFRECGAKDFKYEIEVFGLIPRKAKEWDKLRGLQIDNLHKMVLSYLKKF